MRYKILSCTSEIKSIIYTLGEINNYYAVHRTGNSDHSGQSLISYGLHVIILMYLSIGLARQPLQGGAGGILMPYKYIHVNHEIQIKVLP